MVHFDCPDASSLGAAVKHLRSCKGCSGGAGEPVSSLCRGQGSKLWCVVVLGSLGCCFRPG
jgi:hypothetical protein